jgi:hypothetical protein
VVLVHYLAAWNAKKIAEAGGEEAWKVLSPAEQVEHNKNLIAEIVAVLEKEAYNALSPKDHQMLDLFSWGSCWMHKDLNIFKGGNTELMAEWEKLNADTLVLLTNKAIQSHSKNLFFSTFLH